MSPKLWSPPPPLGHKKKKLFFYIFFINIFKDLHSEIGDDIKKVWIKKFFLGMLREDTHKKSVFLVVGKPPDH